MSTSNDGMEAVDFVVITALEVEKEALLRKLPGHRMLDKDGRDVHTYYEARIETSRADRAVYRVIITCLADMGPLLAVAKASAVVNRWHPDCVLLSGIACGIPGVSQHGDVLLARQVADYTVGKRTAGGAREVRWDVHQAGASLFDSAMNLPSDVWQPLISVSRPTSGSPYKRHGVIASGGDVVADEEVIAAFHRDWPKLIGIEMESGGTATGLHNTPNRPEFLMIKAVSDLGRDKHEPTALSWRTYANDVAAAFVVGMLRSGPVPCRMDQSGRSDATTKPLLDIGRHTAESNLALVIEANRAIRFSSEWLSRLRARLVRRFMAGIMCVSALLSLTLLAPRISSPWDVLLSVISCIALFVPLALFSFSRSDSWKCRFPGTPLSKSQDDHTDGIHQSIPLARCPIIFVTEGVTATVSGDNRWHLEIDFAIYSVAGQRLELWDAHLHVYNWTADAIRPFSIIPPPRESIKLHEMNSTLRRVLAIDPGRSVHVKLEFAGSSGTDHTALIFGIFIDLHHMLDDVVVDYRVPSDALYCFDEESFTSLRPNDLPRIATAGSIHMINEILTLFPQHAASFFILSEHRNPR